jgi:quercetin dioxygenase-like cupin family protein
MKAGTGLGRHHVDGRISIQLFEGSIRLQIAEQSVEMKAGALLTLEYGTPHNLEAIAESALLITISWPGGTKDERHARYVL